MKGKKARTVHNSKRPVTRAQMAQEKAIRDENIRRAWDGGRGLSIRQICAIFHHSPHTVIKVIRNKKVGKK